MYLQRNDPLSWNDNNGWSVSLHFSAQSNNFSFYSPYFQRVKMRETINGIVPEAAITSVLYCKYILWVTFADNTEKTLKSFLNS